MATPVSGLYPGGSPYGSIRGTPASGAGYPGADPYAPDARPPGAGAGAYSPLLFGRGAAPSASTPAPRAASTPSFFGAPASGGGPTPQHRGASARTPGLFGGGVGPASASASGGKKIFGGGARLRAAAPPSAADEDEDDAPAADARDPSRARDPSPARVDGGGSPRFGSARGGQQSGSGSPRFGARVMGMGARRRESFDDRRESFGAGGQHEGTPWANRRRGEGRRAAPSSIGGDARNSPFDAGGRRAEGGLGPVGAAAAPTRPRFGGARDEDGLAAAAAAAAAAAPAGGFRRARGLGEDELVMQPRRTTWGKIVEFVIGPL